MLDITKLPFTNTLPVREKANKRFEGQRAHGGKTMNRLLVFGMFIIGTTSAFAAEEPKVEITSFIAAGQRTRAAELCGKVTGATVPFLAVKVTVDPNTDKPGIYNVLVGKDGAFCTTVVSYRGTAEATVWLLNRELSSGLATLSSSGER